MSGNHFNTMGIIGVSQDMEGFHAEGQNKKIKHPLLVQQCHTVLKSSLNNLLENS